MKVSIIQTPHYDFVSASLIEGLREIFLNNNDLDITWIACREESNYAKGIYQQEIFDSDVDFIETAKESDLIIVTSNNNVREYLLADINKPDKTIFIDGEDREDHHQNYQDYPLFFKREMHISKQYPDNVFPFPFAAETRYNKKIKERNLSLSSPYEEKENLFEEIYSNKNLNLACIFGTHDNTKSWRIKVETNLRDLNLVDSFVGQYYDFKSNEKEINTGNRNHHGYFDKLNKSIISVDAYGAFGCQAGRFYESLANACCLLTQPIRIDMPYPFVATEDHIEYNINKDDDLEYTVKYLIENKEFTKKIAKNGFVHLINYHTTEARARYLLEICKNKGII